MIIESVIIVRLSKKELNRLDGYFRCANYLSACQLYLLDNPLLKRELKMSDIKEYKIEPYDYFSTSMKNVKEYLKANKKIKIVANTNSADQASRVAETLKRLGYVEFDDIKTETVIKNNTRQVTLVITVHNTPDFDRLYKEHEDEVKFRSSVFQSSLR